VAHNSKRNNKHTTKQDGDDYVYPTAKIKETKTRSRRADHDLIEAGLLDHEFGEEGSLEEQIADEDRENLEDYNAMIQDINQDDPCEDDYDCRYREHDDLEDDEHLNDAEADIYDHLHDDLTSDCGHDWEDY